MKLLRNLLISFVLCLTFLGFTAPAWAFCGFYVAKADAKLYNQASQVAIARDGKRTVITMANDYQGDVKDFAIVVPVPVLLQESQVNVGDPTIIERLDSFSAPRLVEYFDPDPCMTFPPTVDGVISSAEAPVPSAKPTGRDRNSFGVTIEARFTKGEYDILILSAKESDGLERWLKQNGYRLPQGANDLLKPYIRQKMKFFVAKVNLKEYEKAGFQSLRPLQMAFESSRFMLPIRLGMVNAQSEQDLIVYLLSPKGQIELTNYRTVNIPSDQSIPVFVKNEFSQFYKDMYKTTHSRENKKVAFLEYAWDMASCDPCSADPLTPEELRKAGVFWMGGPSVGNSTGRFAPPVQSSVFITRLHVRYARDKFPEDLMFQETNNRGFFQGRYILNHPFQGDLSCSAGEAYKKSLTQRFEQESQTLAKLTGWNVSEIRRKQPTAQYQPEPWWRGLWK